MNSDINIKIAKLTGWQASWEMLQGEKRYFLVAPDATAHQRIVEEGPHFFGWFDEDLAWRHDPKLPTFSTDLNEAWKLHKLRPDGTTLFNMAWMELPPEKAAYEISNSFVHWKVWYLESGNSR